MKKIILSILLIGASWAAWTKPVLKDDFNDTDFVEFSGGTFILGENCQTYEVQRNLQPFKMNRYETTYSLWYGVRTWAEDNGYKFINPGQEGNKGKRGAKPTQIDRYKPVTNISWYDAVIWCNAFSELYGKTPCYLYEQNILRDATDTSSLDLCICNWDADGFRLPTEAEWEYASRWTQNGFQRGDLASGQINEKFESDETIPEEEIGWINSNSQETHRVGTAGTPFIPSAPPRPSSGNPNGAGLFDMTGNVLEFCWDWIGDYKEQGDEKFPCGPEFGAERVMRGASWNEYTMFTGTADRYSFDPNEAYNYFGFRIVTK